MPKFGICINLRHHPDISIWFNVFPSVKVASLMGESLGFKQSLVAAIHGRALLLASITFRELLTAILPACGHFGYVYVGCCCRPCPSAFAGPVVAIGALCLSAVGFSQYSQYSGLSLHNFLLVRHCCGDRFLHHDGRFLLVPCSSFRVEVDRAMDSSIAGLMALS